MTNPRPSLGGAVLEAAFADLAANDFFLTPIEVARRWRMTRAHLAQLRYKKRGCAFVKLANGQVLYPASLVLAYARAGFVTAAPQTSR